MPEVLVRESVLETAKLEEAKRWTELEQEFLNYWMNRRLEKRWEEHLDRSKSK
jgi:hypothetical protein